MLTVRIFKKDGHEIIEEARSVFALPGVHTKEGAEILVFFSPEGNRIEILEGDVFVMNDNGKTVADYHMHPNKMTKTINPDNKEKS